MGLGLAARGESRERFIARSESGNVNCGPMAMGKRKSEQAPMWVPTTELPVSPGHPFYARLKVPLSSSERTKRGC